MGRSGSSSRRKPSKKKSLKVSSEGYRKKKSRRTKSKKLRHRDDSFSSYSDDESASSSSSSEVEYKTKRSRSRSRNEIKGSKKRNRRRSVSEDSSMDSPPSKKRKRSKKGKKITNDKKKKNSKRDAYISSASSDSDSCSTCKDEDTRSDELGSLGRSSGRSSEKKKVHRDSTNESTENVTTENKPMRLKSVITVANLEKEEEDGMTKDEPKEEIVYDYDDYLSSKSNDSTELVDKKSVVKEVNSGSNLSDHKQKESSVSGTIEPEADNLELILRRKALENLSRFRGGIKTKPVVPTADEPKTDQTGVKEVIHGAVSMPPVHKSQFTWRRDLSVTTGKDEKAAAYRGLRSSGPQPDDLKVQSADLSSTCRVDNKVVNERLETTGKTDQKSAAVVETSSSVSVKEGGSKEKQNENSDNSQFEKKTMSVMRGGEMVQVSYKVYIPNKSPALARRQLKR